MSVARVFVTVLACLYLTAIGLAQQVLAIAEGGVIDLAKGISARSYCVETGAEGPIETAYQPIGNIPINLYRSPDTRIAESTTLVKVLAEFKLKLHAETLRRMTLEPVAEGGPRPRIRVEFPSQAYAGPLGTEKIPSNVPPFPSQSASEQLAEASQEMYWKQDAEPLIQPLRDLNASFDESEPIDISHTAMDYVGPITRSGHGDDLLKPLRTAAAEHAYLKAIAPAGTFGNHLFTMRTFEGQPFTVFTYKGQCIYHGPNPQGAVDAVRNFMRAREIPDGTLIMRDATKERFDGFRLNLTSADSQHLTLVPKSDVVAPDFFLQHGVEWAAEQPAFMSDKSVSYHLTLGGRAGADLEVSSRDAGLLAKFRKIFTQLSRHRAKTASVSSVVAAAFHEMRVMPGFQKAAFHAQLKGTYSVLRIPILNRITA